MDQIPHTQRIVFALNHETDEAQFAPPKIRWWVETKFEGVKGACIEQCQEFALLPTLGHLDKEKRNVVYEHIGYALQSVTEMMLQSQIIKIHEDQYNFAVQRARKIGFIR